MFSFVYFSLIMKRLREKVRVYLKEQQEEKLTDLEEVKRYNEIFRELDHKNQVRKWRLQADPGGRENPPPDPRTPGK